MIDRTLATTELEALARELWSMARSMEDKGNAETIGLAKMNMEDSARAVARQGSFFGQSIAFERAAWHALSKSRFGNPVPANFFE